MSILKLQPSCKCNLWGGRKLIDQYNKKFEGDILAETWELSAHKDGPSTIVNGEYAGLLLPEYIEKVGKEVLGTDCKSFEEFPVLIKFIDAKDKLSIQVHPNNEQARAMEGQYGKTEMWYILEAEEGAFLYYGFQKEISTKEFKKRIEDGTLTEVLNAVPVHKGETYFIPSGTLHAIGAGIVIAEIQQNSNVTYRIFDYNRRGTDGKLRDLHVDKAIQVTKLCPPDTSLDFGPHLAKCEYFTVDHKMAPYGDVCTDTSFVSILVLEGEGEIINKEEKMPCKKGDSFFLPAGSGAFSVTGNAELIITRV